MRFLVVILVFFSMGLAQGSDATLFPNRESKVTPDITNLINLAEKYAQQLRLGDREGYIPGGFDDEWDKAEGLRDQAPVLLTAIDKLFSSSDLLNTFGALAPPEQERLAQAIASIMVDQKVLQYFQEKFFPKFTTSEFQDAYKTLPVASQRNFLKMVFRPTKTFEQQVSILKVSNPKALDPQLVFSSLRNFLAYDKLPEDAEFLEEIIMSYGTPATKIHTILVVFADEKSKSYDLAKAQKYFDRENKIDLIPILINDQIRKALEKTAFKKYVFKKIPIAHWAQKKAETGQKIKNLRSLAFYAIQTLITPPEHDPKKAMEIYQFFFNEEALKSIQDQDVKTQAQALRIEIITALSMQVASTAYKTRG